MNPADNTEKAIRFGCGFVFGLALFSLSSIWFVYEDRGFYLGTVLVAAVLFGLAALRYGDAFWRWFARWFSRFS